MCFFFRLMLKHIFIKQTLHFHCVGISWHLTHLFCGWLLLDGQWHGACIMFSEYSLIGVEVIRGG